MPKIFLLLNFLLFSSCSLMRSASLDSMSELFYQAGFSLEKEGDWQLLKESLPATIKLNDSLLSLEPENEFFILNSLKGYSTFAFAIYETQYLEDFINMKEDSLNKKMALINYSKAFELGKRYFKLKDVEIEELLQQDIPKLLDEKMDQDIRDYEAVFFTAQSLIGMINMNKDKVTYISRVPIALGLFNWVCKQKPDINFGACDIFYGAYESGRPRMMGGDPVKGKKLFLDVIEKWPNNWLARVSYMQYYLIPMVDQDGYKGQRFFMEQFERTFEDNQVWIPKENRAQRIKGNEHLRAYQAIALERYRIIKKHEKEIF